MSFGGGWFFLAASEAISVLNQQYTLPGIGSYVGAAIDDGDLGKVGLAIADDGRHGPRGQRAVLAAADRVGRALQARGVRGRRAAALARARTCCAARSWPRVARPRAPGASAEPLGRAMRVLGRDGTAPVAGPAPARRRRGDVDLRASSSACRSPTASTAWSPTSARTATARSCTAFGDGAITFARVVVLVVVATLVWVPIGVWIGFNPRVARIAQPIVQILASFPANFLFPFATARVHHGRASASTSAASC